MGNKKRFGTWLFIIFLITSLAMIGCGQSSGALNSTVQKNSAPNSTAQENTAVSSDSTQTDVRSLANIQRAAPVQIVHKVYSDTFRDQEGDVLVEAQMVYPEISNPNTEQGIATINAYYQQQLADFQNMITKQGLIEATKLKEGAR